MNRVIKVFIASMMLFVSYAYSDSVGYYFIYSNGLIDLPYPGNTFYAEVALQVLTPNHLDLYLNPYTAPGEFDTMGNFINSPLVAGSNFGVQKFAMDSTLISSREDFDNFLSLYDIIMPESWTCQYNGQVSDFGHFEFVDGGTGGTRQDPLIIQIIPKAGADLTGYEFNSVFAFVEQNAAGYYFATHVAGFTTDSSYWDSGFVNPNSAYFAVGEYDGEMPIVPEPSLLMIFGASIVAMFIKKKQ